MGRSSSKLISINGVANRVTSVHPAGSGTTSPAINDVASVSAAYVGTVARQLILTGPVNVAPVSAAYLGTVSSQLIPTGPANDVAPVSAAYIGTAASQLIQ